MSRSTPREQGIGLSEGQIRWRMRAWSSLMSNFSGTAVSIWYRNKILRSKRLHTTPITRNQANVLDENNLFMPCQQPSYNAVLASVCPGRKVRTMRSVIDIDQVQVSKYPQSIPATNWSKNHDSLILKIDISNKTIDFASTVSYLSAPGFRLSWSLTTDVEPKTLPTGTHT